MTELSFFRRPDKRDARERAARTIGIFRDFVGSRRFVQRGAGGDKGWYSVRALANDAAEIMIYDEVGLDGISAAQFVADLRTLNAHTIRVCVNSPGGDVFDAIAIYNAIVNDHRVVETRIDGLAASAASFIALAGPRVTISDPAMLMIHNAWGISVGDKNAMRDMAAILDRVDGQLVAMYAKKTGRPLDQIRAWMSSETWFTAQEALDNGFVDAIIQHADAATPPSPSATNNASDRKRRMRVALAEHDLDGGTGKIAEMRRRVALGERCVFSGRPRALLGASQAAVAGGGVIDRRQPHFSAVP